MVLLEPIVLKVDMILSLRRDVMLDRYWHGNASRVSPEAPLPVVHVQDLVESPGGAGNVTCDRSGKI